MIYKKCKKLIALLLCLMVFFTNTSLTAMASEIEKSKLSDAVASGSFILTAAVKNETIIEPEEVFYQEGDTIRDALKNSSHTFTGIDSGVFISVIDGMEGSYSIFTNDQSYDLDRSAEEIKTLEFTELVQEEIDFTDRDTLLIYMNTYRNLDPDVLAYVPAAKTYAAALEGLRTANADTRRLYQNLKEAVEDYDKTFSGEDITVNVTATQGNTVLKDPELTFTDENGYQRTAKGSQIKLGKQGTYHFTVSDGGYNRSEGTVEIDQDTYALNVALPDGEWFGEFQVTRPDFTDASETSRVSYKGTQDPDTHTAEYFIEDSYGYQRGLDGELLYLYAEQGTDLPDPSSVTLHTVYTGLDGNEKGETLTSWESIYAQLSAALDYGMEGREIALEAWYDTENDGQAYRMIQSYALTLARIPTCLNILITDEQGTSLLNGFYGKTYEYDVHTSSKTLTVSPTFFEEEGSSAVILCNETEVSGNTMTLKNGSNTVSVIVSHTNGQKNTYLFHVTLSDACTVTLKLENPKDTVAVFNENDSLITPVNGTTYDLTPGETYYYTATKDQYYHTTAQFTAKNGLTVTVAEPVKESAFTDLCFYNIGNIKQRTEILPDQEISSSVFEYTYHASDALSGNAYLQATPDNDYELTARYYGTPSKDGSRRFYETAVSKTVDPEQAATTLNKVYIQGSTGQTITLRASKTKDSCIYYQDITLHLNRLLSLTELTVSTEAGECLLFDAQSSMVAFDRDRLEYYLYVPTETTALSLNGSFYNKDDSGYYALVNDKRYDELSDIAVELNGKDGKTDILIQVCNENEQAMSRTYQLHVIQKEQIRVKFQVSPKDALVYVVDQTDGSRIYPDETGTFSLMPGFKYSYTVTAYGYVGKTVTDFQPDASAESKKVTIFLTEAEKNTSLKELDSTWPTFRDPNNNTVLDEKLPTKAEDAVLYWATGKDSDDTDEIIDGFDGYCGHPILVDDHLYTYDNNRIFKINTVTGEIEAVSEDTLIAKSSFAIQGMTYGEGMVFVGLSNGSVQAFNADTLESLWVYQDTLGGQPNSPITYKDGYVYTGFWISESKNANFVCISVTDEDPSDHYESKLASWIYQQKGGFYWSGAYITDEFMLIGTDDGENGYDIGYAHLLSLDPKTGELFDDLTMPHTGDIRSSITYDADGTKDYYFTSKGGYLYRVSASEEGIIDHDSLKWVYLENGTSQRSMSTSTPTVYNGRAYVGVSGSAQFTAYSGHNISVIDLETMSIAYQVPTKGYPQTSGVLTTAYDKGNGEVYVYFFDNYKPGKLRAFSDRPGQTELKDITKETYQTASGEAIMDTGYVLFTPADAQSEYAICSPVVDEYGTMYFRNDSNYMMAVGSVIETIEITKQPKKTSYRIGDVFCPDGMEVTATYRNGTTRDITDYVSYSKEPLTAEDTEFSITFEHVMYQDRDGEIGVEYTAPMAMIRLNIGEDNTPEANISRLFGKDRYATGLAVADELKEVLGVDKFETVIIATGTSSADALSGSYLASVKHAPILLTNGKPENIAQLHAYIKENVKEGAVLYILGGYKAVPKEVETIEGYEICRLSGSTRYETNLKILTETGIHGQDTLLIATGKDFADSLSASATARPILLLKPGTALNEEQTAIIESFRSGKIRIIGGTGAVSAEIEKELTDSGMEVKRLSGKGRYETSVAVAEEFFDAPDMAVLAYGKNFPDGLCGGPLAAALNAPLLLAKEGSETAAADYVQKNEIVSGYVLGGTGAISEETVEVVFGFAETK